MRSAAAGTADCRNCLSCVLSDTVEDSTRVNSESDASVLYISQLNLLSSGKHCSGMLHPLAQESIAILGIDKVLRREYVYLTEHKMT